MSNRSCLYSLVVLLFVLIAACTPRPVAITSSHDVKLGEKYEVVDFQSHKVSVTFNSISEDKTWFSVTTSVDGGQPDTNNYNPNLGTSSLTSGIEFDTGWLDQNTPVVTVYYLDYVDSGSSVGK